ncbi:MAG: TetR family transcriptional regulator C-terminal domain-containing protein, partial [Bacteroidota bacterium]
METSTKKSSKKKAGAFSEDKIQKAYVEYLLTHGQRPASVFKFCLDLGIKEDEFYNHFGSFDGLERHIWKSFVDTTISRLKADEAYAAFSSREKILAFYYTFFEELKSSRSFVLIQLAHRNKLDLAPEFMKDLKTSYLAFVEDVLNTGKTSGEVAKRPYLDKQYPRLFWLHMGFLLIFWRDDNSAAFEKTDAAIEKSVNLAFD